MTEENHGLEQAKAQFASIKEMVEAQWVAAANEAGWKAFQDEFNVLCWRHTDGSTWAGTAKDLCENHDIEPTQQQIDDAQRIIHEDPLSVLVRSDWREPGARGELEYDAEYEILLCTGGPAVRIRGDLDRGQPSRRVWSTRTGSSRGRSTTRPTRTCCWRMLHTFGSGSEHDTMPVQAR